MIQEPNKIDEKKEVDFGSEISVMREQGGRMESDHRMISITLKSKTESIESLFKKLEGVI